MNCKLGLSLLSVIIVVLALSAFAAEQPTMQVRVSFEDSSVPVMLRMMGLDVVYVADGQADVFTNRAGFNRLLDSGYQVEIIHDDVTAFYSSRLDTDLPNGGYKTLGEIYAYLDDMIAAHPDIMTSKISIGHSIEGRDIWAVKISDNPDVDEEEPELFFNALTHAREVITPEILLYFTDHLTDNYGLLPEITEIVDNRELWFVVMVNPDGYYYNQVTYPDGGGMWRKNRRDNLDGSFGVDLNRNYGYLWGYDDFGSDPVTTSGTYRGTSAFSEPEIAALRDFSASRNFVFEVHYHSYSNCIIWPWTYQNLKTPDQDLFAVLADSMASYNDYAAENLLGYLMNGGACDWFYGEQVLKPKILSFLIEAGSQKDGFWPDIDRVPELVAENLGVNLYLCRAADTVYNLAPPQSPALEVSPSGESDYTVSWYHNDTLNPASAYELVELQDMVRIIDSADSDVNWEGGGRTMDCHSEPWGFGMVTESDFLQTREPVYIAPGDTLKFWVDYELAEGYSYVYVQVSDDGHTFENIPGNLSTSDNPYGYNDGNGITGYSNEWVQGIFDMSSFEGQTLWIRFLFRPVVPDPQNPEYSNVVLDDLEILKEFGSQTIIVSDLTDTLYNFTDKPDGDYYYRVRAIDVQDQWGPLSNYGPVSIPYEAECCQVRGDIDHDGDVAVMDAVYFISWLWDDGPAPPCYLEADADGSEEVGGLDLLYLVNYFWNDGPAPVPCP